MPEDQINPLSALLIPHVGRLLAAAQAEDREAIQIISLYNMHCRYRGQWCAALCEAALNAWLPQQNQDKVA